MASISLKYKSKQGNLTAPGDVDPGAMIPITTTTVGTATSSVTFSNIPQSYEHLQVRCSGLTASSGAVMVLRLNSDTGGNYTSHRLNGDGTSAAAFAETGVGYARVFGQNIGTNTANPTAMIIDILDYSNTNKNKTIRSLAGCDSNGSGEIGLQSSLWINTSAVSTIEFRLNTSGNYAQYSSFALYGIKRAGA